ncbi:hypothetical protein GJ496_012055 [Pomphorhynchus laevis]|nr:hypothetical protein GJ496_012055 [Pomphorhynchus laevis]
MDYNPNRKFRRPGRYVTRAKVIKVNAHTTVNGEAPPLALPCCDQIVSRTDLINNVDIGSHHFSTIEIEHSSGVILTEIEKTALSMGLNFALTSFSADRYRLGREIVRVSPKIFSDIEDERERLQFINSFGRSLFERFVTTNPVHVPNNLPRSIQAALMRLKGRRDIIIKKADKGP